MPDTSSKPRKWYVWVLLVLIWPISLSYFVYKKKEWSIRKRIIVIVLILTSALALSALVEDPAVDVAETPAESENTVPETTEQPATPSPDRLEAVLEKIREDKDVKSVETEPASNLAETWSVDTSDGSLAVNIVRKRSEFSDSSIISGSARSAHEYMSELFNHPEVSAVAVVTLGDFTDKFGQTNEAIAVRYLMTRDTADKVNWDGLTKNHESLARIAEIAYIHPTLTD